MKKLLENNKFLRILALVLFILLLFSLVGCSPKLSPANKRFIIITSEPSEAFQVRYAIAPEVLAAIITGGTALTAAGVNIGSQAFTNRQNQKNWEKQNEYNTPASQLARYRAAGLNPSLIYGSGSPSAGNAGAIAPYQTTKFDSSDILNAVSAVANIRMMNSQVAKSEAEAEGVRMDNAIKSIDVSNYSTEKHYQLELQRLGVLLRNGDLTIQEFNKEAMRAKIDQILADTDLAKQAYIFNKEYFDHDKKMFKAIENITDKESLMADYRYNKRDITYWTGVGSDIVGSLGKLVGGIGLGKGLIKGLGKARSYSGWSPSYSGSR